MSIIRLTSSWYSFFPLLFHKGKYTGEIISLWSGKGQNTHEARTESSVQRRPVPERDII